MNLLSCCLVCFPGPGLAPTGDLLSFASPKESKQRKGDPTVCDPFAALRGNLRCSLFAGSRRTRFAQTAASPDPRNTPLLGAARGGGDQPGHCFARPSRRWRFAPAAVGMGSSVLVAGCWLLAVGCWLFGAERSEGVSVSPPFWMRRGAQRFADQGSPLFERSEFGRDPAEREHRRLPAAKRRDAASRVAFSLATFFWRSKRK